MEESWLDDVQCRGITVKEPKSKKMHDYVRSRQEEAEKDVIFGLSVK